MFSLLARTVVDECAALCALVFGTGANGDFTLLSSYGACDLNPGQLELDGVCSVGEVRAAVMKACPNHEYRFRAFPLISESGLFGALVVVYSDGGALDESRWVLIEGLTELTAISFNKAYQHQKLQKAFDDLRISQETLIRAEKFRALGQMSAGIAHDLKNVLNPLLLYTDLIRDVAGDRNKVLELTNRIDRILTRGVETLERLRDFSRQSADEGDASITDLNSIVHEALEISKPRLSGIEVSLDIGSPPTIVLRSADCVTAVLNLLFNAADALEGHGAIWIRTGESHAGAWVEVADNGPGMSEDIKNRIFEPFFTTKGEAGTGLGLAIVYAFTQKHEGRLEVESVPGRGARFRMWFPAAASAGAG